MIYIFWCNDVFGSIVFYMDRHEDSGFADFGKSYYWAIVTMTTLGSGDKPPLTGSYYLKNMINDKLV